MRRSRSLRLAAAIALAVAGIHCGDASGPATKTTLYVYATFANPSVTVSVNGQVLGQITHEYTGSTDCGVLAKKLASDGVLSFPVLLGGRYSISWVYTGGRTDVDVLDATSDVVESQCLFESIGPP